MSDDRYLGEFEHLVLLAVAHLEGDGYGVSVREEIEGRTGRDVSIGAVYATLGRLEEKGFAASRTGEPTPERGGRAKRLFRLTPDGAAALRESRRILDRMWNGLDDAPTPGSAT